MAAQWYDIIVATHTTGDVSPGQEAGWIDALPRESGNWWRWEATARDGWKFKEWQVSCSDGRNLETMVLKVFGQASASFTTTVNPLSAREGQLFLSGDQASEDYSLHVDEVVAVFERDENTRVTVTAVADAGGKINLNGSWTASDTKAGYVSVSYSISAQPDEGYVFDGWTSSEGGSSAAITVSGTAQNNVTWTARFVRVYTVNYTFKTYAAHGSADVASGTTFRATGTDKTITFTASSGYFVLGIVYEDYRGGRRIDYKWSSGTQGARKTLTIAAANQRGTIDVDVWIWPVTTGKILYSPSSGGAILCGSGGAPMAQFVT